MQNRIVVRYQNGRLVKGYTGDFLPTKDVFHITDAPSATTKPVEVRVSELKAVFFVKDLAGDRAYVEKKTFEAANPVPGRKIRVLFKDGELLVGTTQGYQPNRVGFFMVPADPRTNNERIFVVSSAAREVTFL